MSYNECVNEHYVKPTVENLVRYGLFGPLVFSGFDGGQPEDSYDGPWNMSTGLRWSINTMTLYHKPFPNLSDVVYTYPSTCIVPFYAGYEKTEKFNPEDGYTSPLEMPLSEAYKRGYDFFNGYGFIGLGNKEPEFDDTCDPGIAESTLLFIRRARLIMSLSAMVPFLRRSKRTFSPTVPTRFRTFSRKS